MRIWHDWEFIEDGYEKTIQPISVGMVTEDGQELYLEFFQAPWTRIYNHEWLRANVIPALAPGHNAALVSGVGNGIMKSNVGIRSKVHDFLLDAVNRSSEERIELWGWYSAYDHVCLAQLFGRMIDLPEFVPMWTNDLKQEVMRMGNPRIPSMRKPGEIVHNALDDARAEKRMSEWLDNYQSPKANVKVTNSSRVQIGNGNTQVNSYLTTPSWKTMGFKSKEDMTKFEARTDFPGWDAL
jgi:hypothetical protein